jgi:tetratricopeptide (TPR) repeat protein
MKKKYFLGTLFGLLLGSSAIAQNSNPGADYLNTGELKVAKEIFEQQISKSPAEAYYYLGEVAYKEGNASEAKANYDKGLSASPDYVLNDVGLGKLLLKSNPKEAENLFSIALKKDKKDVNVLVAIAQAYYDNGMKDKGEKYLADARKVNKKAPAIYILQGDLVAKTNVGEAAGNYAQAINFDPNCTVAYIKTAQVYETVNPSLAEEMLIKAVEINPTYTLAYKYLGEIYSRGGQYNAAIDVYKKYFAQGAYDVQDLTRYAAALYFTGKYDEAKTLINEGIAKAPNNFVLNRLLMYSYLQSKDYTNGLTAAEKFFALPKGDSEYIVQDYMSYGELLSKNERLSEALEQYDKAIKLDPSKSTVYKEIAIACKDAKQYADAAKYYQEYVNKADSTVVETMDYFNLGQVAYNAGRPTLESTNPEEQAVALEYMQQADKAFAVVTQRVPDSYLGYLWRGNVTGAIDLVEKYVNGLGKPYYEKVIELLLAKGDTTNNGLLTAYQYLAYYYYLTYEKTNNPEDKAQIKSYSEKILQLDATNGAGKQLLDYVNSL